MCTSELELKMHAPKAIKASQGLKISTSHSVHSDSFFAGFQTGNTQKMMVYPSFGERCRNSQETTANIQMKK